MSHRPHPAPDPLVVKIVEPPFGVFYGGNPAQLVALAITGGGSDVTVRGTAVVDGPSRREEHFAKTYPTAAGFVLIAKRLPTSKWIDLIVDAEDEEGRTARDVIRVLASPTPLPVPTPVVAPAAAAVAGGAGAAAGAIVHGPGPAPAPAAPAKAGPGVPVVPARGPTILDPEAPTDAGDISTYFVFSCSGSCSGIVSDVTAKVKAEIVSQVDHTKKADGTRIGAGKLSWTFSFDVTGLPEGKATITVTETVSSVDSAVQRAVAIEECEDE